MHRVYTQAFRSGPMGRIMKQKLASDVGGNSRPLRSGLETRVVAPVPSLCRMAKESQRDGLSETREIAEVFRGRESLPTANAKSLRQPAKSSEKMCRGAKKDVEQVAERTRSDAST